MARNKEVGSAKDRMRERQAERKRERGKGERGAEMSLKVIRIGYGRLKFGARVPPLARVREASSLLSRGSSPTHETQGPQNENFRHFFSSILSARPTEKHELPVGLVSRSVSFMAAAGYSLTGHVDR